METDWGPSWLWGLALTALTIVVHAVGIVILSRWLEHVRAVVMRRRRSRLRDSISGTTVVGTVALLLAALHGLEAAMWALALLWLGAIATPHEAILFSLDSMATRGASGLKLASEWQLLGALEASAGMLAYGVSTAYIFAILLRIMPLLGMRGFMQDLTGTDRQD
ncbi:MAG: hypothetical protein JSR21_12115 [Proteobacteria bacterium]|nr:hypothetical protein [Pseudomonadota bacterium]